MDPDTLLEHRAAKFRKIGAFQEGVNLNPRLKRNMKPRDAPLESDDKHLSLPSYVYRNSELSLSASSISAKSE